MTVAAVKPQARAATSPISARSTPPPAPAVPARRRGFTPLTPMRKQAAQSMRRLAGHMQQTHPDMTTAQHIRDAARVLESGNEEAAQRHLRAAAFTLSPQSLMRHGLHTDDAHISARESMHGVHRHLLLVKDIEDAAEKNQAAINRDSYGDNPANLPPRPQPQPDPNAGYGPGALAQKPTARQPPGNQALNAPARTNSGGSDPNVADPVGPQPRGSKQFARTWDELARVIDMTGDAQHHHIPGSPLIYEHGYVPLTMEAAQSHFKGKVPKGWTAPSPKSSGKTEKAGGGSPEHAAAAYGIAANVRLERGLSRFQREEAEQRLHSAAGHLNAGDHAKAASELDEAMRAASMRGGGVIKGSTAAQARDLRNKIRAEHPADPEAGGANGVMSGPHPADKLTVAGNPGATAKAMDTADLHAADAELGRRAALLGKPGQLSKAHKAVLGELAARSGAKPTLPAKPARNAGGGNEQQLGLISQRTQGGDKTSGEMKAGDMLEGHQAIGQAPVGILGNERRRIINGGYVKGSFSDPWWMAGPGGKFAVSQRWKSPAQTASQPKDGKWQTVKIPAKDERVLTPVSSAGIALSWDELAAVIELSAKTATLEVTPAPYGKPGGPGLYDVKGLQHTPYFEQVVKALMEKRGMDKGRASAIAYGALRKWSRGGGKVHPEVRAAAAGALAGEKAKGAAAKAAHGHAATWDQISRYVELASAHGHHIAGTPDTYVHGWKLREGLPGKKELYSQLPTADKMSKTALKQHMDLHHNGGMDIGGRRVGPKNPSVGQLLAWHEAMHADERLSVNPPGTADNSALKGTLSRTSRAHTHGETGAGLANASMRRTIDLVGPKGYIHGWIFVGIPAPGDKVSIPGHGRGTVVSGNAKHARVRLPGGKIARITHNKDDSKPGKLAASASAPPAPKEDESDLRAANRKQANASIAKGGETLFHGTNHEFKPGDIIDAHHANAGVTRLHEGKQYAFASTDPSEATFAGKASHGHSYRVEPVGGYEFDPHQGSATSRRNTGGFRVVEEVKPWSGAKMDKPFSYKAMTPAQKKVYVKTGKVPEGMEAPSKRVQQHAAAWDAIGQEIALATVMDFYNPAGNPGQARVPTGQPLAGQFTKGQSQQQQSKGKQAAKGKTAAKGRPDAHQKHVAHMQHVQHVQHNAKTKAGLLATAKNDRAKASALIKQRAVLRKALASASGKTSSGQAGSTTAANATTASSAPATTAAAASTSSPGSTAGGTAASGSSSKLNAAQVSAQITALNTQIGALLKSAAQAQVQASKL